MKKVPERMCVVCRNMFQKNDLVRVCKNEEGVYEVDPTGKKNGRGVYVCHDCIDKCCDKKILDKILKTKLNEDVYKEIGEYGNNKD